MALVYERETGPDSSFAIWKIEESAEELFAQLQLKDHETNFLDTLINGKRNLHWLSTRVLLRKMMKTSEYIDCQVDGSGKPFLTNFPYHISLSHSYDYAAVMVSPSSAVGIDIELIKDKIERIRNKFMTAGELAFIEPQHRIEHLYVCWCAKEAVYKLHGKKNVSFLDNIELHPFSYDAGGGTFDATLTIGEVQKDFKVNYEKFDGYMIGYVSDEIRKRDEEQ